MTDTLPRHAIIARLLFIVEHAAFLMLMLLVAAATGTLVLGSRASLALRAALGMAVAGQTFVLLATIGALRPWTLCAFAALVIAGGAARMTKTSIDRTVMTIVIVAAIPLFLLALYPPVAFDETLYHLPFVQAMARSGAIRFGADMRFPAFPQLHESLCVPAFLLVGDTATHLAALAEVIILAGLMMAWPQQRTAGFLAAALVIGNPIVVQMATITYVDVALMLFVAAGFYCLDRSILDRNPAAAGFLFGTACSVKYLGWFFAAAAFFFLLIFAGSRRRSILLFSGAFIAAVLPMYGRIVALTGNPFFPFLTRVFGRSPWALSMPATIAPATRVANAMRLFWDITFVRERVNAQPPYSPLFAVAMLITLIAATRDRRAAFLTAMCAAYIAIFTFLPQDSRYLLSLLPLVSVAAAISIWPLLRKQMVIALSVLAIAPGLAYAGYRIVRQGPPPLTTPQRRQYLEAHIPAFRALEHRGPGRIYVCGAEQLKYFGGEDLLGDVEGPYAFPGTAGVSPAWISKQAPGAGGTPAVPGYLLVSRAHCLFVPAGPRFELVYADDEASLWRVRP
jgi:hypothetical protein